MYPYIYIGEFALPVYGTIIVCAFVAGLFLCSGLGKKYGIAPKYIICSGSFVAAGLLTGAKLMYLVTKLPDFINHYPDIYADCSFAEKAEFLLGGYVFYGGLFGAVAGVFIFCRAFRFDTGAMLTILTPLIPFAQGFGRIGCFFGGCCYGIEYHGIFSIHFPYNSMSPSLHLVPRFPVQLTESLCCFVLFGFLFAYTKKKSPGKGVSFGAYLVCYGSIRFLLEFLRGDSVRGIILGLSVSQWISLILLPVGVLLLLSGKKPPLHKAKEVFH